MGRPRELTEAERETMREQGLVPVEVWLPDIWSDRFWSQVEEDCRLIREADKSENMNEVLEAFATDLWNDLD